MAYRTVVQPKCLRRAFALHTACIALVAMSCLTWSHATGSEQRRRIYFLESLSPTQPAAVRTIEAFRKRLSERTTEQFEIFIDYMDLGRFPGEPHVDRTVRFLAGKYAEAPPHVLIPLGRAAVPFLIKHRDTIVMPQVPVIVTSVPTKAAADATAINNAVAVVTEYNVLKTLELAQRLQPAARNLVFVAGASDYDRSWADDARRELAPYSDRYETRFLVGLPYDEMLKEISQLSADTIVIVSFVLVDGAGLPRVPPDVAAAIADVSSAPVYSAVSSFFGRGIVGGYIDSFESHGVAAADLAFDILSGKAVSALDQQTKPLHRHEVDARALKRWSLSANNLPPDVAVSFREPTIWQEHRGLVIAVGLILALQSCLVAALLIQRRRRQYAENLLKESEERMTFTAAAVNIGLWQFDVETGAFWATEHCRVLFGLKRNASLTRDTLLAAIHPDDRGVAITQLQGVLQQGRTVASDVRIPLPDNQTRWVRIRARPHADNRNAPHLLSGIFVDVTDQKLAEIEAALQRREVAHLMRVSVMGELSGSIAHEINQPLTAIMSNAQAALNLLADDSPNLAEVRDVLRDIIYDDGRAGEVIHRLRNLMKKGEHKFDRVDLNDLVTSTIALLNNELISRGIGVKAELADSLPVASGDSVQLQQVLLNLIMNAMDAMVSTPNAQRFIVISTCATPTGGVEVMVKDRGPGIHASEKDRLTEPFYTTKEHGLGLGLAICATILQAHGGSLTLANNDDRGAVAGFLLPAHETLMAAQ